MAHFLKFLHWTKNIILLYAMHALGKTHGQSEEQENFLISLTRTDFRYYLNRIWYKKVHLTGYLKELHHLSSMALEVAHVILVPWRQPSLFHQFKQWQNLFLTLVTNRFLQGINFGRIWSIMFLYKPAYT